MINFLIITHGEFGAYLVEAAESIVGAQPEGVRTVAISPRHPIEEIRGRVTEAISALDGPEGVIVAVDMPGGTPTNVALLMLKDHPRAQIVSGLNLYMLVGAFTRRRDLSLQELARKMVEDGRRSVIDLKSMLAEERERSAKAAR